MENDSQRAAAGRTHPSRALRQERSHDPARLVRTIECPQQCIAIREWRGREPLNQRWPSLVLRGEWCRRNHSYSSPSEEWVQAKACYGLGRQKTRPERRTLPESAELS